ARLLQTSGVGSSLCGPRPSAKRERFARGVRAGGGKGRRRGSGKRAGALVGHHVLGIVQASAASGSAVQPGVERFGIARMAPRGAPQVLLANGIADADVHQDTRFSRSTEHLLMRGSLNSKGVLVNIVSASPSGTSGSRIKSWGGRPDANSPIRARWRSARRMWPIRQPNGHGHARRLSPRDEKKDARTVPIRIADNSPARRTLESEGVIVMGETEAARQDIRPSRIASSNSMPDKITTETQIARVSGATPSQVVNGYSVFANGGYRVTPYSIDRVTDSNGKIVMQAKPTVAGDAAARAIDPRTAWVMDDISRGVTTSGTAARAHQVLKRNDIGGKTGTTNEAVDVWFSGFTPTSATTVWMGFDQPKSSGTNEFGSGSASTTWLDYMQPALKGVPETKPAPR
ncbi:hypothetical protein OY671_007785, partial [Metschnikowia pulcherrima]